MEKNLDYWIDRWQKSRNFCVENDRIKPKSYLFSAFPKTNTYGYQDGNIRKVLVGDFFSRYKRMQGFNVLFPFGYDSLGYKSFMENKKRSNVINDDISMIFKEQVLKLGIGLDGKKEIDLKHNSYLSSLQLAFIELYEKGYIKYDDCIVYLDESSGKYYDLALNKKELPKRNVKAFYLDIKNIANDIYNKINELNLEKNIKNKILEYLNLKKGLNISFYSPKGSLNAFVNKPELIGGASFIAIHPDRVNFEAYIEYSESNSIENYFSNGDSLGVFTGSYVINPLTGGKIPVFISVEFDEDVHLGIPCDSQIDLKFALNCSIEIPNCVEDGMLVNSDFLNGKTIDLAKELIIEAFVEADIATNSCYFEKDKIIVSSSDPFGALIPFLMDENKQLYSLKEYLPFNLSKKFRPVIDDAIEIPANVINGSINHIFSTGMLPILSLIYDDIGAGSSIFSKESISDIVDWNGLELLIISNEEMYENIFFPLCIFTILEKESCIKLPSLFKYCLFVNQTYDKNDVLFRKANNNIFDLEYYIEKYGSDSLRLYFLSEKLDENFIFKEEELALTSDFIKEICSYLSKGFIVENNKLDYDVYNLAKECLIYASNNNVYGYVNCIVEFLKNNLKKKITKKSGTILVKLLYPIIPFHMEEIYCSVFKNKYLISDDGFNL